MHYNTHSYQTNPPSSRLSSLPLKTKLSPHRHSSNQQAKLPPIYNSNKILKLNLTREERTPSQHTPVENNPQRPLQIIQSQRSIKNHQQAKSHSSIELIPRQGRIIFNKDSPFKIKRKYLITCPSEHEDDLLPSKKAAAAASSLQRHEAHPSYCKRKQKNSLHLDKNSYSMLQLFDRIESLKRFFDNKSNLYNKIKRFETKESTQSQQQKQSAPTHKNTVQNSQKQKILKVNTEKSDSFNQSRITKVKALTPVSSKALKQQTKSQLRKEIQIKGEEGEMKSIDVLHRRQKQLVIRQEQLLEPWSSQNCCQFEEHSHFLKWA